MFLLLDTLFWDNFVFLSTKEEKEVKTLLLLRAP